MSESVQRADGRRENELRPLSVELGVQRWAEGSAVISVGNTVVICSATIEDRVPPHLRGSGTGHEQGRDGGHQERTKHHRRTSPGDDNGPDNSAQFAPRNLEGCSVDVRDHRPGDVDHGDEGRGALLHPGATGRGGRDQRQSFGGGAAHRGGHGDAHSRRAVRAAHGLGDRGATASPPVHGRRDSRAGGAESAQPARAPPPHPPARRPRACCTSSCANSVSSLSAP